METRKFADWLQILGNLSILAGLIFVGFQLYQDRELKRAELMFSSLTERQAMFLAQMGENPSESLRKLFFPPHELTDYDMLVVYSRMAFEFSDWERSAYMERYGLWEEDWRENLSVRGVFATPLGQRFLESHLSRGRSALDSELSARLMSELADTESDFSGFYDYLRGSEYARPE